MTMTKIALIACLAFPFANIIAQSAEKDPAAIVELGGATSWNVEGGAATFAPDLAVEVTPIENNFERGHEQSINISGGLLIAIP